MPVKPFCLFLFPLFFFFSEHHSNQHEVLRSRNRPNITMSGGKTRTLQHQCKYSYYTFVLYFAVFAHWFHPLSTNTHTHTHTSVCNHPIFQVTPRLQTRHDWSDHPGWSPKLQTALPPAAAKAALQATEAAYPGDRFGREGQASQGDLSQKS